MAQHHVRWCLEAQLRFANSATKTDCCAGHAEGSRTACFGPSSTRCVERSIRELVALASLFRSGKGPRGLRSHRHQAMARWKAVHLHLSFAEQLQRAAGEVDAGAQEVEQAHRQQARDLVLQHGGVHDAADGWPDLGLRADRDERDPNRARPAANARGWAGLGAQANDSSADLLKRLLKVLQRLLADQALACAAVHDGATRWGGQEGPEFTQLAEGLADPQHNVLGELLRPEKATCDTELNAKPEEALEMPLGPTDEAPER
eukprot:6355632-Alexandrium_andersonii.AAC.1